MPQQQPLGNDWTRTSHSLQHLNCSREGGYLATTNSARSHHRQEAMHKATGKLRRNMSSRGAKKTYRLGWRIKAYYDDAEIVQSKSPHQSQFSKAEVTAWNHQLNRAACLQTIQEISRHHSKELANACVRSVSNAGSRSCGRPCGRPCARRPPHLMTELGRSQ